ncbi:MAG: ParB/RepB/Spo0J family partition protein [Patescibacteria group bacterium]
MTGVTEIYADKINEPTDPMRSDMDRDKIDDLANSIKQQGLIQPITVRPVHKDYCEKEFRSDPHYAGLCKAGCDRFEVVAGHRRFKACLIAGLVKIPCIVKEMTDVEVFAVRAHENLFRDDINPVDEAIYIGKLIGADDSKIPEMARQLNRSVAWVEDRLNILTYPDYFLPSVRDSKISLGVAKALAAIGDDIYRKMFFNSAVANGMAVWQANYYYSQWQAGVFKEGADILPPDNEVDRPPIATIKVKCVKCGQVAEEPNLQSVFIHISCPPDVVTS